jgi:hypothetical protein
VLGEDFVSKLPREQGRIVLPSSGFKGMLRSVFEAVTESCVLSYQNEMKEARAEHDSTALNSCEAKEPTDSICPACSVFGCFGRRGKLGFSSFVASGDKTESMKLPRLYSPFEDQEQQGESHGRKFYRHSTMYTQVSNDAADGDSFECLPVGSKLTGTITYQGLTDDEFGALLFALGLSWDPPIYHKVGYAKPAYLGSVSLQVEPVEPPKRYRWKRYEQNELIEKAKTYYAAHEDNIADAVTALRELWSERTPKPENSATDWLG